MLERIWRASYVVSVLMGTIVTQHSSEHVIHSICTMKVQLVLYYLYACQGSTHSLDVAVYGVTCRFFILGRLCAYLHLALASYAVDPIPGIRKKYGSQLSFIISLR